ncbi:MAG: ABC transporter ATP-binding protein [Desulfobacterales bacterium]|nr:ABC transporter ATP-binding protein [Desulfobacterales bacterium]
MVNVINLKKSYQMGDVKTNALNGIDLEVKKGEFIALMGASGSGKSTLLHIIGGIDNPSQGEVVIDGKNIRQMSDYELTLFRRNNIGFVFQFFNLMPGLTVEENIMLPILIAGQKSKPKIEKLKELLELTGLCDRIHHKPGQLSGGEQQRVAFARALIIDPLIVLLDEPTGSLDSKNGRQLLELLLRSHRELGTTIIMVTHSASAAAYAGQTFFMKDGSITDSLNSKNDKYSVRTIHEKLIAL